MPTKGKSNRSKTKRVGTSFFPDPDVWKAIALHIRQVFADNPPDYVFRAWVVGCSTGEEAYSLAILLRQAWKSADRACAAQIFATDLDREAIDVARRGEYPAGIAESVSPTRRVQLFVASERTLRVRPEIRDMVVFAAHDVIEDPPFTRMDLIVCRNLLTYLEPTAQKDVVSRFHYALKPGRILMLGASESVRAFGGFFKTVDAKRRLFQRRDVPLGIYASEVGRGRSAGAFLPATERPQARPAGNDLSVDQLADRVLLRELLPPTVLVHKRGNVVLAHGQTGDFLEPTPGLGDALNIFRMAREGLHVPLTAAMRQALRVDREVVHRGVEVRSDGRAVTIDLLVRRLTDPEPLRGLLRISFVNTAGSENTRTIEVPKPDRTVLLERELEYARDAHQGTREQLETANEELRATNEEIQSVAEELLRTNEELETSKEEMRSLNEELQTLNAELVDKLEELSRVNDDMKNFLEATNIATIFLDNDLSIRRYTEQARCVLRLLPTDVGRPIEDLVPNLRYRQLVDDAREVLRTLTYREAEVQGEDDAWYLMRIVPYRTVEHVIDGLVVTFVDITFVRDPRRREH
jgi:two-component system CheB/CheR fusion protein